MVNAGQHSCACDWLCWYVATGTRRGKHCALFCLATGYPVAGSMRRRLDKLVRRRFEDQSMVCLVSDFSVRSTGCPAFDFETALVVQLREIARYCRNPGSAAGRGFNPAGGAPGATRRRRLAPPCAAASFRDRTCSDQLDEEFPSVLNSSVLIVQADEGVLNPVVDLIDDLPPSTV
ncbi:hypothetical protein F511_14862 [Dorcoceras hygrometricum]|uniref:Uncharacterized protein n=1 Tax=Dorcoceras hygrometricum TaxID=472368 RepID=A0A2Z7CMF0_9LAMI|nr:hypothetical protein F511_14862 [Dorcoceras hygrometricum]